MSDYNPEEFPHPGEVLSKELEEIGLSVAGFARYLGVSSTELEAVCAQSRNMDARLACKIARALGSSPRRWMELQISHDLVRVDKSEYETIRELGSDPTLD